MHGVYMLGLASSTSIGTPSARSASTTVADSSWRMKPWSTWRQMSRSAPMALWSSAAHTDESTPPETRQSTFLLGPTVSRM